MEILLQDTRYALRSLLKDRAVSAIVVACPAADAVSPNPLAQ